MLSRVSSTLRRFELPLFALLLLGAAWLRFYHLVEIPGGFHGDEAVAGLEGERILREGSIGPYSPLALGQPAGPLYLSALSIRLFGPTIWAVRAVSALLGTLTVGLLFLLLRRYYGRKVAFIGAGLLATLHWHLHFSRIGFPIIAWPLCAVAAAFAVLEAARRRQARWWSLAGALTGVGIYSYNAHAVFILALGLWIVFHLARERDVRPGRRAGWLGCFVLALFIVALPMGRYALDPKNDYFSHARFISLFSAPGSPWPKDQGEFEKAKFLAGRYASFWDNLSWHPAMDWSDGTSVVPGVPAGILALALLGLVLTPRSRRGPLLGVALCCLLCAPLAPVTTVPSSLRRALVITPFLCFGAAVGLVEIGRRVGGSLSNTSASRTRRIGAVGVVMACGSFLVVQSLTDYFDRFEPSPPRAWTFVQDFTDMIAFLNTLPPDSHVLFLSDRWSGNYEPRQFLAPHISIEDRSSQFGQFTWDVNRTMTRPTFVLMGLYKARLPELQRRYPGSRVEFGPPSAETGQPAFVALWPALPVPRPGEPVFPMPP